MSNEHRPDADTTDLSRISNPELQVILNEVDTRLAAKMQEFLKAKKWSDEENMLAGEYYAIHREHFKIGGELLYRQSIQDMYYQIGQRIDW
jgi:hypothetical protein